MGNTKNSEERNLKYHKLFGLVIKNSNKIKRINRMYKSMNPKKIYVFISSVLINAVCQLLRTTIRKKSIVV